MSAPHFAIQERHGIYTPKVGSFGRARDSDVLMWMDCRETFHIYADAGRGYYDGRTQKRYYFVPSHAENTMDLIGYVEDRLNIKNKTRFHFQYDYNPTHTIRCGVLQVEPAPFWTA